MWITHPGQFKQLPVLAWCIEAFFLGTFYSFENIKLIVLFSVSRQLQGSNRVEQRNSSIGAHCITIY